MAGYAICPYCKATVQPLTGANGKKSCPLCRNTGKPVATPSATAARATAAPAAPPTAPGFGRPNAPGATASLVCGVIGVMTGLLGFILGIVAIVQARKAKRAIAKEPGRYDGDGLATAGRILGIVALVIGAISLVVLIAAVALVVVASDLPQRPDIAFSTDVSTNRVVVAQTEDGLSWSEFVLAGTASCMLPTGDVDVGDAISCTSDGSVIIRHSVSDSVVYSTAV